MPAYPKNFIEVNTQTSTEPKQLCRLLEDRVEVLGDELASGLSNFIVPTGAGGAPSTPANINQAEAWIYIDTLPDTNDKIGIYNRTMKFVVTRASAGEVTKGANTDACATNLRIALNLDLSGIILAADHSPAESGINLQAVAWGSAGNSIGISYISGDHADISFDNFSGGDNGVYGTLGQLVGGSGGYLYYCKATGLDSWGRADIATLFPTF